MAPAAHDLQKTPIVIHAGEVSDLRLKMGRQPQIGGVTVRKQGIAAIGWEPGCIGQLSRGMGTSIQVTSVCQLFSVPGL